MKIESNHPPHKTEPLNQQARLMGSKVHDFVNILFQSSAFWVHLITASTLTGCILTRMHPGLASAIFLSGFFTTWKIASSYTKLLKYELTFFPYFTFKQLMGFQWWTKLEENFYIGALPLQKHTQALIEELNIKAVVSLVEPYEVTRKTPFSDPITPQDWQRHNVEQILLEVADTHPVSLSDINRAITFIHEKLSQNEAVYLHCKGGMARSATIAICYYMKYLGLCEKDAIEFVTKKRGGHWLHPPQLSRIHEFALSLS